MLKNMKKIVAIFLVLLLIFSAFAVLADNEENSTLATDQAKENNYKTSDVFLADKEITVDYVVDGNLFAAGETVIVNSQIGGDAFICAKKIVVGENGYVFNNLFAAAETIEINGVVYDIFGAANNITITGGVYRDLKVTCNNLVLNGVIGRNAYVSSDNMQFNTVEGSKATIYGNLKYSSNEEFTIPENVVEGEVTFDQIKITEATIGQKIGEYMYDLGSFLACLIIIWALLLWLAPKFLESTNKFVGKTSLGILGKGLLTLILVPVICIVLILLQLTSSISIVLLTLYILAAALSKALFTIIANKYICSKLKIDKNIGILGMLVVSGIVVWALTQIPYLGGIVSFLALIFGLGVLVKTILPSKAKTEVAETAKK